MKNMTESPADALARQAARFYRRLGWNPLPSCRDQKRPALKSWAQYRAEAIPDAWLEPGGWWTPNVQVLTGSAWGLTVIDCDGQAGRAAFQSWRPPSDVGTWVVKTPSGGRHLWYRLPESLEDCPSGFLWKGSGDHEAVEVLADGKQVVAPPSRYGDKPAYEFVRGPRELPEPAVMPAWLLSQIDTLRRRIVEYTTRRPGPEVRGDALRFDLNEVHAAIPSLLDEAEAAGLRIAYRGRGHWAKAHAVGRDDVNPSCSVHKGTGFYKDFASGETLPFFALLSALDPSRWPTWADAVNALGARYGVPERRSTRPLIGNPNFSRSAS